MYVCWHDKYHTDEAKSHLFLPGEHASQQVVKPLSSCLYGFALYMSLWICLICEVPCKGPVPYSGPQRDFFAPFEDRYFTTQWSAITGPSLIQSEKFLDLGTVTRPPSNIYARVNCSVIRYRCTRVQGHLRNLFRRPSSDFGLSSLKHHT